MIDLQKATEKKLNNYVAMFKGSYDNVKHHPDIPTFPHHKHIDNNIISSSEPDFTIILSEIKGYPKL